MAPGTVPSKLRLADDQRCVLARPQHLSACKLAVTLAGLKRRTPYDICILSTPRSRSASKVLQNSSCWRSPQAR